MWFYSRWFWEIVWIWYFPKQFSVGVLHSFLKRCPALSRWWCLVLPMSAIHLSPQLAIHSPKSMATLGVLTVRFKARWLIDMVSSMGGKFYDRCSKKVPLWDVHVCIWLWLSRRPSPKKVFHLSPSCLPVVQMWSPHCLPSVFRLYPSFVPVVSQMSPGCGFPDVVPQLPPRFLHLFSSSVRLVSEMWFPSCLPVVS